MEISCDITEGVCSISDADCCCCSRCCCRGYAPPSSTDGETQVLDGYEYAVGGKIGCDDSKAKSSPSNDTLALIGVSICIVGISKDGGVLNKCILAKADTGVVGAEATGGRGWVGKELARALVC